MPTASLPQDPDIDQLRKQARELQRAVRQRQPEAIARASRWHDVSEPEGFPLTAAQMVLARENRFASWVRMRRYVQMVTERAWTPGLPAPDDEPLAHRFLRLACLNYGGDDDTDLKAARELLALHPELPGQDLMVASACADADAVRAHLAGRSGGAAVTGGPFAWSPILYLAYARHDPDVSWSETSKTLDLLLGAGADPNDGRFWHALPTPFTVLTGVLGHGELRQPWHRHSIPFARRLLEAGADPNDGQALYNRMFGPGNDHLDLLFEFGLGRQTNGPWHRLLQDSLESPEEMLRSLLAWAITHDQRDRVTLLARHGVDINRPFDEDRTPAGYLPAELAHVSGHPALGDLLVSLGADPPRLGPADTFVSAALAGDAQAVRSTPQEVIAAVRRDRPGLVTWAAAEGARGAVGLLVSVGFDVNAKGRSDIANNDPWHTALHVAAEKGDVELVSDILALGADPNVQDHRFGATPLGWARYFDQQEVIPLLEPVTTAT